MKHYPLENRLDVSESVHFENDFVTVMTDRMVIQDDQLKAFKENDRVESEIPLQRCLI